MSSFDFTTVANPHAERLQRAFGELHLKMVNLANAVLDDRPDLMQRKEEWSRDWAKLVQDLDANAIDGKTYGLSTALSADEGALGCKAQQSYECDWPTEKLAQEKAAKQKGKEKEKEKEKTPESDANMEDQEGGDSDADASGEEEVPTVVAPLRVQRAATTDAVGSKKVLKKDSDEPIVHLVPCEGCHKVKKPCVRRVAVACDCCKTNHKACKYATHGRGVAKVRAAARAKAKVAAGPSTTPLPTSPSAAEEEDEEGSEDEEEGESAEGSVVESWKRKERESEVSGDFDPLADTGFTKEDLLLEGRVRLLYAKMTTMQVEEDAPV
ncbi:hypothetical protein DFJ58DRAFT_735473 [Suillus subalutaceus]|uniref:uncharacterized protein n=1 Tax=Suillus subalutaceus TaxID=48586 RepID=UPI001B882C1C|nr:uncharacterized protein DFJ58DRAFT_735473 [Suillus subalutaceus]KAG1835820.1 hypothetical protein DFJ58DRAFT_735473 [Suillus subalutaceus]